MTSNVARGCGESITPAAIQQEAAARLRVAGVTVSNIHNAQLTDEVDCVAVTPSVRTSALAVHQCLSFSEVVSASSTNRAMLATTWHNCESYMCAGARCERQAQASLGNLIDAFFKDYSDRFSRSAAPAVPALPGAEGPRPPAVAYLASAVTAPEYFVHRVVFFSLYIALCLSILVRWQIRRHAH